MKDNNNNDSNNSNALSFSFDSRLRFWEEIKGLRNVVNTKDRQLFNYEKKQKNMTKQLLQLEKENKALRSRLHYLPIQNNVDSHNYNDNHNLSHFNNRIDQTPAVTSLSQSKRKSSSNIKEHNNKSKHKYVNHNINNNDNKSRNTSSSFLNINDENINFNKCGYQGSCGSCSSNRDRDRNGIILALEELEKKYETKCLDLDKAMNRIEDLELSVRLLEEASQHIEEQVSDEWKKIIQEKQHIHEFHRKTFQHNNNNDNNNNNEDVALEIIERLADDAEKHELAALTAQNEKEVLSMAILDALNRERMRSRALQSFISENVSASSSP